MNGSELVEAGELGFCMSSIDGDFGLLSSVLRLVGAFASPASERGVLSILIYHRVLPKTDPLRPDEPDARLFELQVGTLAEHFNVLPLGEAIGRLAKRSLPRRAACLTFDDGYADNAEVALNILKRHRLTATFFVASGFLNGGIMWNDAVIESIRKAAVPALDLTELGLGIQAIDTMEERLGAASRIIREWKYLPLEARSDRVDRLVELAGGGLPAGIMMTDEQLRSLREAGMEVGGHTVSHPILSRLRIEDARAEVGAGKEQLESLLRERIRLFAYPNGRPGLDYQVQHVEMVKRFGFEAALSTAAGVGTAACDRFQLPRFTPWDTTPTRFALRLLSNCMRRHPASV